MSNEELSTVAEVELIYKTKIPSSKRTKVSNSETVSNIFKQFWNLDIIEYTEGFKVMYLNKANKVLGIVTTSQGGLDSTVADVRTIMQGALLANATGIILCHNHPSGNTMPSQADLHLTKKIVQAGEILNISVLDHIILAPDGENISYLSFADEGLM